MDTQRFGRYRLHRLIGAGAMAQVYEATDEISGRRVALKVLHANIAAQTNLVNRFVREAEVTVRLNHPNIVSVYDYGREGDAVYLAMEYLAGGSLDDLPAATSLGQQLTLLRQIASALDYAHQRGIVHRDIKLSNILLDADGSAKLTDFGVAQALDTSSITAVGTIIGTPLYISPEQINGDTITPAADIYSFGVLAYRLLSGRFPFEASGTPMSVLMKHLQEPPPPISAFRAELSPVVDAVFAKALAKGATERYPSVGAFIEALSAAILLNASAPIPSEIAPALPRLEADDDLPDSDQLNTKQFVSVPPASAPEPTHRLDGFGLPPLPPALPRRREPIRPPWLALGVIGVLVSGAAMLGALPIVTAIISLPLGVAGLYLGYRHDVRPPAPPAPIIAPDEFSRTLIVGGSEFFGGLTPADSPHVTIPIGAPSVDANATIVWETSAERVLYILSAPAGIAADPIPLVRFPFTIGRINADLRLDADSKISRLHAELTEQHGRVYLTDAGSANGTLVNGMRLKPEEACPLLPGAEIVLSPETRLRFGHPLPTLPDLSGQRLHDRYQLEAVLKAGGRAVVYRAHDTRLDRPVAIKLLPQTLLDFPAYAEQFEMETRAAARLRHPNIVQIHDHSSAVIAQTEVRYLTMELLPGGTLTHRLEASRAEALRWLRSIADGLSYTHEQGLIHCGLKPASILFNAGGGLVIADFALARRVGQVSTALVGAAAYLAPEQWEEQPLTPAVDQYALAVIAYRLLTGSLPFEGQDNPQLRVRNLERGPRPAHEVASRNGRERLAPEVSGVLRRALAAAPSDRFRGVAEFIKTLEAALREAPEALDIEPPTLPIRPVEPPPTTRQVFISYRRKDSAGWATHFAAQLEQQHGLTVFVDTRQLDGATQFPDRLRKAIENCAVFVMLLGAETLNSPWVIEEVQTAYALRKPMIPVFQEGFDAASAPPAEAVQALLRYDGVKLLDHQNLFVEESIARLAGMIRVTLERGG